MPGVFISYRREDSRDGAGRIEDALKLRFGKDNVFRDTSSIPAGARWDDLLHEKLFAAQVVLVLIGQAWLDARDENGRRRLDEPEDYVRREIEHGLTADRVRVVPLLLNGTPMPRASQLPDSLAQLVDHQAFTLADETWDDDVERLRASLQEDIWRQPRLREWGARGRQRGRGVVAGGQQAAAKLRSVRTFDRKGADINELARLLRAFYEQQKLETQIVDVPRGVLVQARAKGIRAVAGMSVSLTVCLSEEDDKLIVEIGAGRWADKAAAAALSPWIPPLLFMAGYGAHRQRALPKNTYRFISSYLDGLVPT